MEPTQTPDSAPSVAPAPVTPTPKVKSSVGALIALVIVVLALVAGAVFFLKERVMHGTEEDISTLQEQGTSTDPTAIEADLSSESPDTFDADLDAAFNELDASFDGQ